MFERNVSYKNKTFVGSISSSTWYYDIKSCLNIFPIWANHMSNFFSPTVWQYWVKVRESKKDFYCCFVTWNIKSADKNQLNVVKKHRVDGLLLMLSVLCYGFLMHYHIMSFLKEKRIWFDLPTASFQKSYCSDCVLSFKKSIKLQLLLIKWCYCCLEEKS